jgi:hypothetical protein
MVRAGALSIRPFQVSRWRLRRTRHLWVLNGVLVLRKGLKRALKVGLIGVLRSCLLVARLDTGSCHGNAIERGEYRHTCGVSSVAA